MWSQIIPIAELALTALGLVFVYLEFRKSNHVKKSEFVKSLLQELKEDPDISKEVYSMQYFTFHYSGSFHDSTEEMAVDKALQFLSYICYLSEEGIISKKEFSFFEFDISQALRSRDLINYMYNLYHFEKKVGHIKKDKAAIKCYTFRYLLEYARRKGLIDKSFFDRESGRYPHYLNF